MKGLETSLTVTKELVYFCDLLLLYYIFVYPVKSYYFTVLMFFGWALIRGEDLFEGGL